MSWLQTAVFALRPPDQRPIGVVEQEILDELEFHLAMRALDNANAGMSCKKPGRTPCGASAISSESAKRAVKSTWENESCCRESKPD